MLNNISYSTTNIRVGLATALCFIIASCTSKPQTEEVLEDTSKTKTGRSVVGVFTKTSGSRPSYPTRIATAADGTVFVSDVRQDRVFGIKNGEVVSEISDLDKPIGLAVWRKILFIGNRGRGSVELYDLEKKSYLRSLGSGDGEFSVPNDIEVTPDGKVFVADSLENTVKIFDKDGPLVKKIGKRGNGKGEFLFPSCIAVDSDELVVGDQGNHRVQVFNHEGVWQSSFGEPMTEEDAKTGQTAGRFTRIQGIALDSDGIFVLDSFHATVQEFSSQGTSRGFIGTRGRCDKCIALGLDVTIDRNGELLVTDPENGRWVSLHR